MRGGVRVFARAVFDLDPPWELVPDHGYYTNRRRLPRSPRPQSTIESLVNHAFTTPICFSLSLFVKGPTKPPEMKNFLKEGMYGEM